MHVNVIGSYSRELLFSSCVGIFWLSDFQDEITDISGFKRFTEDDIKNGFYVQPEGGHHLYDFPRDTPRGRVELGGGRIKIYLGEDFPKEFEDEIRRQVIQWFNLSGYEDLIQFIYHYHWTTKDGVGHKNIYHKGKK